MKKKMTIMALVLLLSTGCGKIPTLSNGDQAVVTLKDGVMISVNDLYGEVKNSFGLQSLISLIDTQILEKKYPDKIEDAKAQAKETIESLKKTYGDQTDQMVQYYTGYQNADAYEKYLYLSDLQQNAIDDYAKSKITDKQMQDYYKDNIYGDIAISHILVTSKATDDMTDDEVKAKEEEAKNTVKEIIQKLKDAKDKEATFNELVIQYSEDEATKGNNGSLGYVNDNTLSSSYDEIIKAAKKLDLHEFSTDVITTSMGYHVVFVSDKKEKPSFEEVKSTIIDTLVEDLKTEDKTINITALQELRKEYDMEIIDSELQRQYANYIQNSLAQAQNTEN